MKKIITICSSVSFYQELFILEEELKNMGYSVLIPKTANLMKRTGNFDVESHKTWYTNSADYHKKTALMKHHFDKVIRSDGILVVNLEKNGLKGYIGGNTLMEMVIAFHYKKPIFILNPIDEKLGTKEEVYGLRPIFLNGNLPIIKKIVK
jgi:hypothetical protein